MAVMSLETFLQKAKEVHKGRYNLSNCNFLAKSKKITVSCPVHGNFYPRAADFLAGSGCRKCQDITRNNYKIRPFETFVEMAREVHGDKYEYVKNSYRAFLTKTEIICKTHGSFWQTPANHVKQGQSCPKCLGRGWNNEDFLKHVEEVHEGKYDYSKTKFTYATDKITVTCPEHGDFEQVAYAHLDGAGCRECATEDNKITKEEFLERAYVYHKDLYDYSKVVYKDLRVPIEIVCKKHGSFWQSPSSHSRNGCGCPDCATTFSKPHQKVVDFLKSLGYVQGVDFLINDREFIKPLELDIVFPSKSLAIEVNGSYWHSTNKLTEVPTYRKKHRQKTDLCKERGVVLLQFMEEEISTRFALVCSLLKQRLSKVGKTLYARKCVLKEVSVAEAENFLKENHIQGYSNAKIAIGLYSEDELVQIATFGKPRFSRKHSFELVRLCTLKDVSVVGGASKLLHFFETHFMKPDDSLVSYCDLRLFEGKVYEALGFTRTHYSDPNYNYYRNGILAGSRGKFQKHKLSKILENFDPSKTELENMLSNGYRILFDCGNSVWEYIKK